MRPAIARMPSRVGQVDCEDKTVFDFKLDEMQNSVMDDAPSASLDSSEEQRIRYRRIKVLGKK
jgi:hypothetical protein